MNILSLFDWISCGRLALERAGIQVDKYFASEVDKYAIQIAKKNYPDTIHIGSVTGISYCDWALFSNNIDALPIKIENWCSKFDVYIDMIIWWSPCQDLSIAKKDGKWLQWEKSWLFFEYVRLLKEVKPKYFLLENVASMKKADKEEITRILTEIYPDTQCYLINSALVSAQNRKRLYWTNIQWVEQPEDKGIVLKDILEESVDKKYIVDRDINWYKENKNCLYQINKVWKLRQGYEVFKDDAKTYSLNCSHAWNTMVRVWQFNSWWQADRVYSPEWKSVSLSANGGGRGAKTGLYEVGWVALRNRWEWKKPEFNWTEKANSMTTVQTDSMVVINPIKWISNYWWHYEQQVYDEHGKTRTIKAWGGSGNIPKLLKDSVIRKLTPIECERLQTLPDNYTEWISNTQRYKAIWNGWTVDIISHIFFYIK